MYEILHEGKIVARSVRLKNKRGFYITQVATSLENYLPLQREHQATTLQDLRLQVSAAIDKAER